MLTVASDILIFNDRYSDNVGDGVIAECLEFGLRSLAPGLSVRTLDIGGRSAFGGGASARPGWMRLLRNSAPQRIRGILARRRVQRAFRAQVADAMRSAYAVVIGGGQLVTGSSTFFAERISVIADEARARGVPLHVHAVGVADPERWCMEATALLSAAIGGDNCRSVTVRDVDSAGHWARAFGAPPPAIAPDPALVAGHAFSGARTARHGASRGEPAAQVDARSRYEGRSDCGAPRRIGVGVIAPAVIHFFGNAESVVSSAAFVIEIVTDLIQRGDRPILFTNGSEEDQIFLSQLCDALQSRGAPWSDRVEVADRPRTPEQLVRCIGAMDAVVAHRLHANIIAYALGIPNVALAWDAKLRAFQQSVGRQRWLIDGQGRVAPRIAEALAATAFEGVDAVRHARHVDAAWDAMAELLRRIAPPAAKAVCAHEHCLESAAAE